MVAMTGGCHCGGVRYEVEGQPRLVAVCHCSDCRRHAGAPMVSWAMIKAGQLRLTKGTPKTYASSVGVRRDFCPDCGTGLFYANEAILPGMVDVQSATFDDPDALPPKQHVQVAERISWMTDQHKLPAFDRFPQSG